MDSQRSTGYLVPYTYSNQSREEHEGCPSCNLKKLVGHLKKVVGCLKKAAGPLKKRIQMSGNSLQPSLWRRISNGSLSGQRDSVLGEAEPKAAPWMALLPPVEQELTQFNRKPLSRRGLLFLVSYRTGCFSLPARWNVLSITMKGLWPLRNFWRPPAPLTKRRNQMAV